MADPTDAERADWLATHTEAPTPNGATVGPAARRAEMLAPLYVTDVELERMPSPQPLVDGWLYRDSLAWLHGKPGHGKSFVALDVAACVAGGRDWHGSKVHRGPVVYVAAEAANQLPRRVAAWKLAHAVRNTWLTYLVAAPALSEPIDVDALLIGLAPIAPVLVVIDTQSRVTPGWTDTDAGDMAQLIRVLDRIRAALQCCVLVVHHEPRNATNLRGSTVLEGAADTIIRCERDGSVLTIEATKDRAAVDDEGRTVQLTLTSLGPSAYVSHDLSGVDDGLSATARACLTEIADCETTGGATISRIIDGSELSKATVYRALKLLRSRDLVYVSKVGNSVRYRSTSMAEPDLFE